MPSKFDSNIREIAAEIKLMEKKNAAAVRKAIRVAVAEMAAGTTEAIKESASWSTGDTNNKYHPHSSIPDATGFKISFNTRSGGAKITTNAVKAPHARPLEKGSKGSGGAYDRHPVFERNSQGRKAAQKYNSGTAGRIRKFFHLSADEGATAWVNQPTRPFFYSSAKRQEPLNEERLIAAVDAAFAFAGWRG